MSYNEKYNKWRRENKRQITDKTDWKLSKTEKQSQNEKGNKEKKAK